MEKHPVMTILEAHIVPDNWEILERGYQAAKHERSSHLVESYLVQSTSDPNLWRIITIWDSHEGLEETRRESETPRGVQMFQATGEEPQLELFEIINRIERPAPQP
ncbi:MAG: MFS transporter [Chloroflexi bacterium]|nr:MFS transporter [Chloroflexota bacterium]